MIRYSPFFGFDTSGLIASDSFPSWISMLELSLRGDRGLLGLRTLWKTDCTFPLQSCKKKYLHWCKEIKIGVNLGTYVNIHREFIDRQIWLDAYTGSYFIHHISSFVFFKPCSWCILDLAPLILLPPTHKIHVNPKMLFVFSDALYNTFFSPRWQKNSWIQQKTQLTNRLLAEEDFTALPANSNWERLTSPW